ncbi:hypothetical protein B296_00028292 [Ensete ventricosum]|uniref:Uncharacterized protein n=1 Tax=Ensete ventricosum TaxID=4639 RepID=A0A426ZI34_ENSVE|nr:hypothetical protein B296_00028292 [Ensete ventricosum]
MSCSVLCSTGRAYRNDELPFPFPFPLLTSPPPPPSPSSTTTMYSNLVTSAISENLQGKFEKRRLQSKVKSRSGKPNMRVKDSRPEGNAGFPREREKERKRVLSRSDARSGSRATRRGREEEERELGPPPCPRHAPRPLPPPPCSSLLYSSSDTAPTHRSGGAYKWARLIRSPSLRFLRIRCNNPCVVGGKNSSKGRLPDSCCCLDRSRFVSFCSTKLDRRRFSLHSSNRTEKIAWTIPRRIQLVPPMVLTPDVGPFVGTDHEMGPRLVRYASSRKQTPPRPRSAGPALLALLVAFGGSAECSRRGTEGNGSPERWRTGFWASTLPFSERWRRAGPPWETTVSIWEQATRGPGVPNRGVSFSTRLAGL